MSNKLVLLDRDNIGQDIDLSQFHALGDLEVYNHTNQDQVISRCRGAKIILTNKVKITHDHLLELCGPLKGICIFATGMDNVDSDTCEKLGIKVLNAKGYSTQSVTEHTFSLYFALSHRLSYFDNFIKKGKYQNQESFTNLQNTFETLSGKKWGIIGLGSIGKMVGKFAQAFGAEVYYHSTSGQNKKSSVFRHLGLKELLRSCDIISIHCPLNSKTKNLISTNELSLIKEGSYLINVARGGIINECALVKILQETKIYVALDVFKHEPLGTKDIVLELVNNENVIFTPHVAWASLDSRIKLKQLVLENAKSLLI